MQLPTYFSAAAQCNHAQLEDNMPDYNAMLLDGVTPACYYNLKAQKAEKTKDCRGRDNLLCDNGFSLSNF